jgi:hypothetical protein
MQKSAFSTISAAAAVLAVSGGAFAGSPPNAARPAPMATLAEAAYATPPEAYTVSSTDDPTGVHDLVETSLRAIAGQDEDPGE